MAAKTEPSGMYQHAGQLISKLHDVNKGKLGINASLNLDSYEHEECCGLQRLADLLEQRVVALPTPPTPLPSDASDYGGDEKNDSIQQTLKLEYKLVDEIWDDKSGQYKIVDSVVSKLDKLDELLFVVRERTDKHSKEKTAYVDIKSTWIRDILREVCRGIRSISLADSKPLVEMKALFHVREDPHRQIDLQPLDSEHDTARKARKHLNVFLNYLETAFKLADNSLFILLSERKITYDLLWALFKPNAEVYTTCKGTNASRCLLLTQMEQNNDRTGSKFMDIQTRYLGSDGKALGEVTSSSSIPIFSGERAIELLTIYPLQYHPEKDTIRKQLVECGRRYVSLLGIHHKMYTGRAFDYDEQGHIVSLHVDSKIIVDFDCFHESMPNYLSARVQEVRPEYSVLGLCDVLKPVDIDPSQLKPEEFLACSPTVLGFSLEKKRFLEFAVNYISDVVWSTSSFDDVKIPPTQKKAIYSLAHTYFSKHQHHASFSDLVQGKGLGINFLLYGPPGVGKTLTAETLANTFKAPLYIVAAGQIGVDHVRVEKFLKTIFKIASRWKAILLLDGADVFLAERALDPHTNALVSVFLRELEHYEGILFLTTNRMKTFDPAILSRIRLPLRYNPLKRAARRAVWRYFINQAVTNAGPPLYSDEVVDKLAEEGLNGREIRNTVLIARSTAEYDEKVVDETYLNDSIKTRKEMEEDFQGAGAVLNTNAYI
ncbi:AAA family ATPase, partial [Metarhizium majus ARSEF 297]